MLSYDTQFCEFLCPICRRLCNIALPLVSTRFDESNTTLISLDNPSMRMSTSSSTSVGSFSKRSEKPKEDGLISSSNMMSSSLPNHSLTQSSTSETSTSTMGTENSQPNLDSFSNSTQIQPLHLSIRSSLSHSRSGGLSLPEKITEGLVELAQESENEFPKYLTQKEVDSITLKLFFYFLFYHH